LCPIIATYFEGFVTVEWRRKSASYRWSENAQERLWHADDADVDLSILVVNQRR
jgi:hypothetical protein